MFCTFCVALAYSWLGKPFTPLYSLLQFLYVIHDKSFSSHCSCFRGWVMSHAYYNTKNYEQVLQSFVGSTTLNETRRSQGTPLTAIVATLVNDHKISPYVFRNYHYPYHSQSFFRGTARSCVWEAVRASSAAPGYFDEFSHLGKIFHDGGMLTNNATNIAIHEAQRVFPFDPVSNYSNCCQYG